VIGGTKDRLVAVGAATDKDEAAIGADLGSGKEFHLASRAGKGECQFTVGAVFDGLIVLIGFTHGGAAARAEGLPTSGTGRIAQIDTGATMRTSQS
jgi:hypothetical protein